MKTISTYKNTLEKMKSLGFEIEVSATGFIVKHNGKYLGGNFRLTKKQMDAYKNELIEKNLVDAIEFVKKSKAYNI